MLSNQSVVIAYDKKNVKYKIDETKPKVCTS